MVVIDISFISSQNLDPKAARIQTQVFREEDDEGAKALELGYFSPYYQMDCRIALGRSKRDVLDQGWEKE